MIKLSGYSRTSLFWTNRKIEKGFEIKPMQCIHYVLCCQIYISINGGCVFSKTRLFSIHWSVIRERFLHGFRCDSTEVCSLSGKALWYFRSMFKECHRNTSRSFSLIKRAIGIKPIHWICMFSPHTAENIFSNQLQTRAIRWVIALVWT